MAAVRLLIDPDGSVLLVAPGEALLIEPAPALFAYKTVEVEPRAILLPFAGREIPLHVAARSRLAVPARVSASTVRAPSRSTRVTRL